MVPVPCCTGKIGTAPLGVFHPYIPAPGGETGVARGRSAVASADCGMGVSATHRERGAAAPACRNCFGFMHVLTLHIHMSSLLHFSYYGYSVHGAYGVY